MAFPTSRSASDVERVAELIDVTLSAMLAGIQGWRGRVAGASATDSGDAQENYGRIAATRTYLEAHKDTPGLAAAYLRRFPNLDPAFDPAAEWAAAKATMDDFLAWFQANWSKKAATGEPAFVQFSATTGDLQTFTVSFNAAARTALLGKLDAMLAAFS